MKIQRLACGRYRWQSKVSSMRDKKGKRHGRVKAVGHTPLRRLEHLRAVLGFDQRCAETANRTVYLKKWPQDVHAYIKLIWLHYSKINSNYLNSS
jgi:hypothetical protein